MGGLEGSPTGNTTAGITASVNQQQPSTSTQYQRANSIRSSSSSPRSSVESTPRLSHHPHTPQHPHSVDLPHLHTAHHPDSHSQPSLSNSHLQPCTSQGVGQGSGVASSLAGSSSRSRAPPSFFCFGLLMVHSTFVTLVVFDLLLLSHSLIFTLSNYLKGERVYTDGGSGPHASVGKTRDLIIAANNLPYSLLMPLFGVQVFWLVSAIFALLSLKTVQPYWQLPYLMISGIVLFATMWLIIRTIQTLAISATVDWALALTLSFSNLVFLVQIYFLYIKIACIKALIRKRKSVVSTATSETKIVCSSFPSKSKANMSMPTDSCNQSPRNTNRSRSQDDDTYSTRSTVVISDGNNWDTPNIPPKSAIIY